MSEKTYSEIHGHFERESFRAGLDSGLGGAAAIAEQLGAANVATAIRKFMADLDKNKTAQMQPGDLGYGIMQPGDLGIEVYHPSTEALRARTGKG